MAVSVAGLFNRLLEDGDVLGVGWGATLKNISACIEPLRKINIQTVPLLGGLGRAGIEVHTNAVASMIAEKYGGIVMQCILLRFLAAARQGKSWKKIPVLLKFLKLQPELILHL